MDVVHSLKIPDVHFLRRLDVVTLTQRKGSGLPSPFKLLKSKSPRKSIYRDRI